MKKYTCFVISPIGKEGTEHYEEYKDLFDLIIVPALEIYDIDVKRGDHYVNDTKIDATVIKCVQDADICICDISEPNPNVYYELGRRDETGKPILLIKKKGTAQSPVDIATRRFFEYDWDGRNSIREAQKHIRSFVEPLIESGFSATGRSATLSDIAETLSRLERKVDRISQGGTSGGNGKLTPPTPPVGDRDPRKMLRIALMQRNIPMAEEAMMMLELRMDRLKFYDQVVETVAAIGSRKAGAMLVDTAMEFFDSNMSFKEKVEYLGCMVSYANRTDQEEEIRELVEKLTQMLENRVEIDNPDPEDQVQIYNQLNRLYHGIYANTDEVEWLDRAIEKLQIGIRIYPTNFLYYNIATCYWGKAEDLHDMDYYALAREAIQECLSMDKKEDGDHYSLAVKICWRLNDPQADDYMEKLKRVDPDEAVILQSKKSQYNGN